MAYKGYDNSVETERGYTGTSTAPKEGQLTMAVSIARKEAERLQECVQILERALCQVLKPTPPQVANGPGGIAGNGGGSEMTCRVNDLGYTISQSCNRIDDLVSRLEV